MIASPSAQQGAIAAQLVAELEAYERSIDRMLQREFSAADYRAQCDCFDRMQMYASALPPLEAGWTELLIGRVELAQAMWLPAVPARRNGKALALQARHRAQLAQVRKACAPYLRDMAF